MFNGCKFMKFNCYSCTFSRQNTNIFIFVQTSTPQEMKVQDNLLINKQIKVNSVDKHTTLSTLFLT